MSCANLLSGMHGSKTLPRAATILALFIGNVSAAPQLEMKVLSGRPDMVSGGSALVELTGPLLDGVRVTLNGQDVTPAFRPGRTSGTLLGKLEVLTLGPNLVTARAGGSHAQLLSRESLHSRTRIFRPSSATIRLSDRILRPGKSRGRRLQRPNPRAVLLQIHRKIAAGGREKTLRLAGASAPGFKSLDPSAVLPEDVATTTTTEGKQVKYIVRVETGVINRSVYRIAFLHETGQPLPDPWTPAPSWNGRLVYSFGGGCGTGFRQGQAAPPVDLNAVAAGYAAAGSTLDVLGTNANDVINAETLTMVKEHFIKSFGVPIHTIGTGGSGGAIQQYTIAQNYPGLLDGITPGSSFPDMPTILEPILDCAVLARAFDSMTQPLTPRTAVMAVSGYGSWGLCESRNKTSPQWIQAAACDASMPKDKIYNPASNPKGVRCSLQDNQANVYGRDPKTGAAPQIFDNVGLQYGLRAFLQRGEDHRRSVPRSQPAYRRIRCRRQPRPGAFRRRQTRAGRSLIRPGRVNVGGGSLGAIPIIDYRRYADLEGNPHDRVRSIQMRLRIERSSGSAANQVLAD